MTFKIGGVDFTPYVASGGFKWTREDVDAPDSGRLLNGDMERSRVATKIRLDITCRPLTATEVQTVLNAIYPQWVSVTYSDPQSGTRTNVQMYSNNIPASYLMKRPDGTEWWSGITFPLIEK